MAKMKIGMPKSLLWFKYRVFWESFFENLGCEIVHSPQTDKEIVERGVRNSVDEICIPVKVFYGHCLEIADACDYIFVPRYWRVSKDSITCPKLITTADTVQQILKERFPKKILTTTINIKINSLYRSFLRLGLKINKNPFRVARAYRQAIKDQREHEICKEREFNQKMAQPGIKLAVIGHEYNLFDPFINQELIAEIENQEVNVITSDLVPHSIGEESLTGKPNIYWSYEREIIGAAYWALSSDKISGVILISSFNCGPDSLLYEQILLENNDKPMLTMLLDENTSKETIKTRIDAFVELLNRKVNIKDYERDCQLT